MTSRPQRLLNVFARIAQKPALALPWPSLARAGFDLNARVLYPQPNDLKVERFTLSHDGVHLPAAWISAGDPGPATLLYIHGGGFTVGSLRGYQHLIAAIAKTAGARGLYVDYRLAPEHPFPAAVEDALTAYRATLALTAPEDLVLAGDSAGGNLVLATLHQALAEGLPMPAAAAFLSPVTDLRLINPSLMANRRSEILLPAEACRRQILDYLADADPSDPRASPVLGRFEGVCPTLFQVDRTEMLHDDTRLMADALRRAGGEVEIEETEGLPHVWQINCGLSPEADDAVAHIGAFLKRHLNVAKPAA
ncbi:alpha/beta hydrolase [Aestuariibius sp. 2305UL40-4]|uniref:alpha/beta hydrolase n=1 Tax=Aestuariibius violaceus TaxID=3234132 RepID=UPI00345E4967